MQKFILLFLLIFTFYGCNKAKNNTIEKEKIKKEVNSILTNWHKAAAEANFNNYFEVLDTNAIYIGTAAEEIWTKEQFVNFSKPYFDKGKAWNFKTLQRAIYIDKTGNVVWFNELLDTWMGTCRGSGVLEKTKESWVIKQYVLSLPIPNNDIQEVINAKKKNDSIFLRRYKK